MSYLQDKEKQWILVSVDPMYISKGVGEGYKPNEEAEIK